MGMRSWQDKLGLFASLLLVGIITCTLQVRYINSTKDNDTIKKLKLIKRHIEFYKEFTNKVRSGEIECITTQETKDELFRKWEEQ